MTPSVQQQAIYDHVRQGGKSLQVKAVAGSGKTSTGMGALAVLPPDTRARMFAFNTDVVAELVLKAPDFVDGRTFNQAGHRACARFSRITFNQDKVKDLIHTNYGRQIGLKMTNAIRKVVSFAKHSGLVPESFKRVPLGCDYATEERLRQIVNGLWLDEDLESEAVAAMAKDILEESVLVANVIDYDDQVYLPVVKHYPVERFPFVFVDESQDLNRIQQLFAMKCVARGGRVLTCGDERQAIYAWRGADAKSMETMRTMFDCDALPLSVSFRCPKEVVLEAKKFCPEIESAPEAKAGLVSRTSVLDGNSLTESDFVLCRYNAPLFTLGRQLIKRRIPCQLKNRSAIAEIITLIKKMEASNLPDLVSAIRDWELREIEKAQAADQDERVEAIMDRADCVRAFTEDAKYNDVPSLLDDIDRTFAHKKGVELSSIHRAKGLERDRVFILETKLSKGPQENNLRYVAITRSRDELIYVRPGYTVR